MERFRKLFKRNRHPLENPNKANRMEQKLKKVKCKMDIRGVKKDYKNQRHKNKYEFFSVYEMVGMCERISKSSPSGCKGSI